MLLIWISVLFLLNFDYTFSVSFVSIKICPNLSLF